MFYNKKQLQSHKNVVNLYVVCEIANFHGIDSYSALTNASFVTIKLTKNTDIGKYRYFHYGIGFDGHGSFSHPNGEDDKNVTIFGVDMSSSVHADNN